MQIDKPSRARRAKSAMLLCATASCLFTGAPAAAQDVDPRAIAFIRDITAQIAEGQSSQSIKAINGRVGAGYYRMIVRRTGDTNFNANLCKAAVRQVSTGSILDFVFDRKYDLGMAVSLPLQLEEAAPKTSPADAKAELGLFRMTGNGDKCTVEFSYFEKWGRNYEAPWVPIDPSPTSINRRTEVVFRPWYNRTGDQARLSAFWKGISAAALVAGPIADFGSVLFKGGDPYAIKGQAQRGLLEFTTDVETPAGVQPSRAVTISPATVTGTSFQPKSLTFDWQLQDKKPARGAPATRKLGFAVEVEYWASRFFDKNQAGDATKLASFDDIKNVMSGYTTKDFSDLIDRPSDNLTVAWRDLSGPISNLHNQTTIESFEAACGPAISEMQRLGFSAPDQALFVYALARGGRREFSPPELAGIPCLRRDDLTRGLAWFGFSVPESGLTAQERVRAAQAGAEAFERPVQGGKAGAENLSHFLDSQIHIAGAVDQLLDGNGQAIFGDKTIHFVLSRKDFLTALAKLKPGARSACYSPRFDKPIDFDVPGISGLPAEDSAIAFMLRLVDGRKLLLVMGLKGRNGDNYAAIDSLWVGTPAAFGEPGDMNTIVSDLRSYKPCTDHFAEDLISGGATPPQLAIEPAPEPLVIP